MFTCIDNASAPILTASSIPDTKTFLFGNIPTEVLAETCSIRPIPSLLERDFKTPLCARKQVAPPEATCFRSLCGSSRPLIGPTVKEWSTGTHSILPFLVILLMHQFCTQYSGTCCTSDCVMRKQSQLQRIIIDPFS